MLQFTQVLFADMAKRLTGKTPLKEGDILVYKSKRGSYPVVGQVVAEHMRPTPVGMRKLLYLSLGDKVEEFGPRRAFIRLGAAVITASELVGSVNGLIRLEVAGRTFFPEAKRNRKT